MPGLLDGFRDWREERRRTALSRLTPDAVEVLSLARSEAIAFGHTRVGTEHMLVGLLEVASPARRLLALRRIRIDAIREAIEREFGKREAFADVAGFTTRTERAIEKAIAASGGGQIEPTHLLAGLLDTGDEAGWLRAVHASGVEPGDLLPETMRAIREARDTET